MRFGLKKRTIQIPGNMTSISPGNNVVFYTDDDIFYEVVNGETRDYWDPSLGLLTYAGRKFIRTDATSFVRDGTDFLVILPWENKCIRRPALFDDDCFVEHKFESEGIWKEEFVSTEKIFALDERVAKSETLDGLALLTRQNGEILFRDGESWRPFFVSEFSAQSSFIRIDLEIASEGSAKVVTLFFEPKTTLGAKQWLKHFSATQEVVKRMSPVGSPVIRNYNTVFYNGEQDYVTCINSLAEAVNQVNSVYRSNLASSNDGVLWLPNIESTDSRLLNQLHFEFENFGERYKGTAEAEQRGLMPAYGPFCQLNDCIHAAEGALANRTRGIESAWWALHCSFLPDFYAPLADEMYNEFTLDWSFGTLYMGYHTLGKDILAAFWNEDLDLFERDEIRPQRISSSEIFVFFGPNTTGQIESLERWWHDKDISQFGYRFGDARNSIGYIPVARMQMHGLSELRIKEKLKGSQAILSVSLSSV